MPEESLRDRILREIRSGDGVLQKDLGNKFGITSSICSKILIQLEREGVIEREWVKVGKSRGYKITPVKREIFNSLFSGDEMSVCIGCFKDCDPRYCASLNKWIEKLPLDN
jgi:DNA-binding MarR family transcriptional regulator